MSKRSALNKLREVGPAKPYNGFPKLALGYHEIVCFRLVDNKYKKTKGKNGKETDNKKNKCLLVELQDEVLFLPQYFSNKLNEEDITELNSPGGETMYLYFGGRREQNQ